MQDHVSACVRAYNAFLLRIMMIVSNIWYQSDLSLSRARALSLSISLSLSLTLSLFLLSLAHRVLSLSSLTGKSTFSAQMAMGLAGMVICLWCVSLSLPLSLSLCLCLYLCLCLSVCQCLYVGGVCAVRREARVERYGISCRTSGVWVGALFGGCGCGSGCGSGCG